jgi:hypothetical protein
MHVDLAIARLVGARNELAILRLKHFERDYQDEQPARDPKIIEPYVEECQDLLPEHCRSNKENSYRRTRQNDDSVGLQRTSATRHRQEHWDSSDRVRQRVEKDGGADKLIPGHSLPDPFRRTVVVLRDFPWEPGNSNYPSEFRLDQAA